MREKRNIINISGLMMDGKNDGLEKELRKNNIWGEIKTIAPTSPLLVMKENPRQAIESCIAMIEDTLKQNKENNTDAPTILIGRSYGGFMALQSQMRRKFEKVIACVMIESPINEKEEVTIPKNLLLKVLQAAKSHYRMRVELLKEIFEDDFYLNNSIFLAIAGGSEDSIVANKAQIPAFPHRVIDRNLPNLAGEKIEKGFNSIILPANLLGKNEGKAKFFSQEERNHLFWPEEKISQIRQVIENL